MSIGASPSFRRQIGCALAYNALDSTLAFSSAAGALIPASNVRTKACGAEVFSNFAESAGAKRAPKCGFAFKGPKIIEMGADQDKQTTVILKLSVDLSRKFGATCSVGFDIASRAWAPDFKEIPRSTEFTEDLEFAGDPCLTPNNASRASATVARARKFGTLQTREKIDQTRGTGCHDSTWRVPT